MAWPWSEGDGTSPPRAQARRNRRGRPLHLLHLGVTRQPDRRLLTVGSAPNAKTIARVSNRNIFEIWRDHFLDVDFVVSSELEAAHAVCAK